MIMTQRAAHLFTEILRDVPLDYREYVHTQAVIEAEKIAHFREETIIEEESLITGFILSAPENFKPNVRSILDYHGVDPSPYEKYLQAL